MLVTSQLSRSFNPCAEHTLRICEMFSMFPQVAFLFPSRDRAPHNHNQKSDLLYAQSMTETNRLAKSAIFSGSRGSITYTQPHGGWQRAQRIESADRSRESSAERDSCSSQLRFTLQKIYVCLWLLMVAYACFCSLGSLMVLKCEQEPMYPTVGWLSYMMDQS